ncbi:HGGxSTG domain-containing protein [Roseomonas sp. BN140053]|uniref:HGGxSTG domain-containing protein n=1 Tax=Roseomonas sp. BN140053 TaxID=3391898 RepID=UPI0039E9AB1E
MSDQPQAPECCAGILAARQAPRCGARTRRGLACAGPAMLNGRCRMHGGASTGPRTEEGLARSRRATWKHGKRSAEMIAGAKRRGEARRQVQALRALFRGWQQLTDE